MERMEGSNELNIKTKIEQVKFEVKTDIEDEVKLLVDDRVKELDDRRRRELNIMVYNLPEGNSSVGKENKYHDDQLITNLANYLEVENLEIVTSYRLGRKSEDTSRPLKVILKDRKQRKNLIKNAKGIRDLNDLILKMVIISKDLTNDQRLERKSKFENKNKNSVDVNIPVNQGSINNNIDEEVNGIDMSYVSQNGIDETIIGGVGVIPMVSEDSIVKEKPCFTANTSGGLKVKFQRENTSEWNMINSPAAAEECEEPNSPNMPRD